jgi:hypothetical protein
MQSHVRKAMRAIAALSSGKKPEEIAMTTDNWLTTSKKPMWF